ncbi:COP23 domain-containing protein [Iningainema tapete]|uniref:Uncharacterized protein n=1 Tax=Iningainema tapete BLCC-T55 TaxID=2748662 RepID=A0A8J6XE78_9CYAN|nr:hypothetical protein [Iningainema tapete BLCC-T55]
MKLSKFAHTLLKATIVLGVAASFHEPSIARSEKFFCGTGTTDQGKTVPATIARTKRGNEIHMIYWLSEYLNHSANTPKLRCKEASQRFQKYYDNGWLQYIRTDIINEIGVICVARTKGSKCANSDIIVTLPAKVDRFEALGTLLDLRRLAAGSPLYLTDQLITYENGEAYINIDILLSRVSSP